MVRIGVQIRTAFLQILSAVMLWILSMFLFELATSQGRNLSIPSVVLFALITPTAYWLLAFGWSRFVQEKHDYRPPAPWLVFGIVFSVPLYFVVALYFRNGAQASVAESLRSILGFYAVIPISVLSITGFQATLPGFLLAIVAVLHATDYAKRVTIIHVQTRSH